MHPSIIAILKDFEIDQPKLHQLEQAFRVQAQNGLDHWTERGMPMIPTYVSKVPTGSERGVYLAADLGGTNFRVCSVELLGNHHHKIVQSKWLVPVALMVGTSKEFFGFMAAKVQEFLCEHHSDHFEQQNSEFRMGFTFSFPIKQTSINTGTLLRWTKGFNIRDAVGKDVGKLFQDELNALRLRVHIAAIVNDTVGALMARSYANENASQTLIGCIVGTGTNAAYFDNVARIAKYEGSEKDLPMAVNTEFGSFDNDLEVLPNTKYDQAVDRLTANPTFHMYEKRVGGMFLGELLRLVLEDLHEQGLLFKGQTPENLDMAWVIDTSVLSIVETDTSSNLDTVGEQLESAFSVQSTFEEREAVLEIARAIGKRSAYLVAVSFAGILGHTRAFATHDTIDIGGDGSVFEQYPGFEANVRQALRELIGSDEAKVTIGLAKDGSGVGAALCALEQGA